MLKVFLKNPYVPHFSYVIFIQNILWEYTMELNQEIGVFK